MTDIFLLKNIIPLDIGSSEKDKKMKPLLTEREQSVLTLLALGMNNNEISEELHISVHTTKAHLETIYEKLEVKNRLQAAIKAVFIGLVDINNIVK